MPKHYRSGLCLCKRNIYINCFLKNIFYSLIEIIFRYHQTDPFEVYIVMFTTVFCNCSCNLIFKYFNITWRNSKHFFLPPSQQLISLPARNPVLPILKVSHKGNRMMVALFFPLNGLLLHKMISRLILFSSHNIFHCKNKDTLVINLLADKH